MRRPPSDRRRGHGFTLVELIVALVLAGALAAATTRVISSSLRARTAVEARAQASQRALLAAERIASDIASIVRDPEASNTLLRVIDDEETGEPGDELLLFTISDRRARPVANERLGFPGTAEGAEYESHYRLEFPAEEAEHERAVFDLWHRLDPVPDAVEDGGGVARLVARGVEEMQIEVHTGSEWLGAWDSDRDGLPYAARVTVTATDDRGRSSRTIRRTVGLARTPAPASSGGLVIEFSAPAEMEAGR